MGSSRIYTLRILVSDDEKLAVEHAAADFGSCVSVYVRHRLLDQENHNSPEKNVRTRLRHSVICAG